MRSWTKRGTVPRGRGLQDSCALGLGQVVEHILGGTSSDGANQVDVDVGAEGRRDGDGATTRGWHGRDALREHHTDGIGHPIEGERLTRLYEPAHLADEQGVAAGVVRHCLDFVRRGFVAERGELRRDVITIEAGQVESPRRMRCGRRRAAPPRAWRGTGRLSGSSPRSSVGRDVDGSPRAGAGAATPRPPTGGHRAG